MRHRAGGEPQADGLAVQTGAVSARVRMGVGAGVVLLIVALVVTVAVTAFAQRGSEREITGSEPGATATIGAPSISAVTGAEVLVHVLGAVKRPGLVSLSAGARVMDAVAAAGGLTDDADVSRVNLARPLADGEQLVVPRVGEAVVTPPAAGADGGAPTWASVNLNTADQTQLETLPRIGPALAQRILDWRTANGRFTSAADLLKVSGIGQKLFDGLKDRVTV
ncbi:ComEA family DNA-binding protein [Leifsonia poae]|uniref:ComEA family DNA-binding protein n=1 Tax=Leifsonia poae TaxID=110933 RepID=UPI001CBB5048|nr:ComEA family DNA-binding protein [Leifsonia poae]